MITWKRKFKIHNDSVACTKSIQSREKGGLENTQRNPFRITEWVQEQERLTDELPLYGQMDGKAHVRTLDKVTYHVERDSKIGNRR